MSDAWAHRWKFRQLIERDLLFYSGSRPEIALRILNFLARHCFCCGGLVSGKNCLAELCPRCRRRRSWARN